MCAWISTLQLYHLSLTCTVTYVKDLISKWTGILLDKYCTKTIACQYATTHYRYTYTYMCTCTCMCMCICIWHTSCFTEKVENFLWSKSESSILYLYWFIMIFQHRYGWRYIFCYQSFQLTCKNCIFKFGTKTKYNKIMTKQLWWVFFFFFFDHLTVNEFSIQIFIIMI